MPFDRSVVSRLCTAIDLPAASLSLLLLAAAPTALAEGPTTLRPAAGGDDTAQLQAALSRCAKYRKPCDLRLSAGVFHTDLLLVTDFVGSLTGAGRGRTIIQPVLDRPLRATAVPYGAEPTLDQPFPFLFHFNGCSRVAISGMTFEIPAAMTTRPYDLFYSPQTTNALMAAVAVTGDERAELKLTETDFRGADNESYFFNNLSFAVILEGQVRLTPTGDQTRRLKQGRFFGYNNRVYRAGNGFMVRIADNVDAFTASNRIDAQIYGLYTEDLGSSDYRVLNNRIRAGLDGVAVINAAGVDAPSRYKIAGNKLAANTEGGDIRGFPANDGIAIVDISFRPEVFRGHFDIINNDIRIGGALDGVEIIGVAGGARVLGNRITGAQPSDAGIWVELSREVLVAGNQLTAIDPALGDVALRDTARLCRVIEPGDTYTDLGTDNFVVGRRLTPPATAATSAVTVSRFAPHARRSPLH